MDLDQPRKRKRRNVNDAATIAELQEQVQRLQAQLAQQQDTGSSGAGASESSVRGSVSPASNFPARELQSPLFVLKCDLENEISLLCEDHVALKEITDEIKRNANRRQQMLSGAQPVDVVSRGLISMDEANVRLQVYRTHLFESHPLVAIPDDATVESMIASLPFIFNTIMSISCMGMQGNVDPDLSLALENHALGTVVTEIMVAGSKTVELLKCLILLSLWYNSPELLKLRRYHILNNVAVTLLHDLGIVERSSFCYNDNTKLIEKSDAQFRSLDHRALILILYFSTVNICLILRRAVFVKWTPFVDECCELLEKYGSDKWRDLAVFSKLNHQLERIHHIIHSPDSGGRPRVPKYVRTEFQTHLLAIKAKLNPEDHQHNAYYYSVEAYLFQPNFDNFNVARPCLKLCSQNLGTETLLDVARCTTSCLQALDEFSLLLSPQVSALPLFYSSRVIYTAGMLLRLRYLILSLPSHIEKELVPRHAIVAIQKLSKQVISASKMFPANYFLKKMTLILRLFIQTYVTQVLELLRHNQTLSQFQETGRFPKIYKDDIKHMINLATYFSKVELYDNVTSPFGKAYPPAPYLDMLSSLASTFHKPKDDDGDRKVNASDPESQSLEEETPSAISKDPTPIRDNQMLAEQQPVALPPILLETSSNMGQSFSAVDNGLSRATYDTLPNTAMPNNGTNTAYHPSQLPAAASSDGEFPSMHDLALDFTPENGDILIDDEFWSNILSADSNAAPNKFHFAQDGPIKMENLLFMN